MASMSKKVRVRTSQNKLMEYRQQSNIAFQLLIKSQKEGLPIDLKELVKFQLTPVPYSIATADSCSIQHRDS